MWSPARFGGDPLTRQYLHRTIENELNDGPNRFKTLPAYITKRTRR